MTVWRLQLEIENKEERREEKREEKIAKKVTAKGKKSNITAVGNRRLQFYFQFSMGILIVGFLDTIFDVTNLLDIQMYGIPLLLKIGITIQFKKIKKEE
jgi:hypothetical protein